MDNLYREKSLERINSPEQLNDYIRVTTPSVWLVLIAVIVLLIGILAWCIFGEVTETKQDGSKVTVHPITFVTN